MMRLIGVILMAACAIFSIIASYRVLLAYSGETLAPLMMAALSGVLAIAFMAFAHFRASRKRERMKLIMTSLIDHKPLAGLAAAIVAGAAARFGVEPDDLFPIFEAFVKPFPPAESTPETETSTVN